MKPPSVFETKNCLFCAREIQVNVSNKYKQAKRFCNLRCATSYRYRNVVKERTCVQCGSLFELTTSGRHKNQITCSISCALKHYIPTKQQICARCGTEYTFKGRTRKKYCNACRKLVSNELAYSWQVKNRIKRPGVGKGGAQRGEENHEWKGGEDAWTKYKGNYRLRCLARYPKQCFIPDCPTPLDEICIHHIDRNPEDYSLNNLIPLCRNHHDNVHERKTTVTDLEVQKLLFDMVCQSKIAENSGNPEMGIRPEGESQGQRLGDEIILPRGRDTSNSEKIVWTVANSEATESSNKESTR